MSLHMQVHLSDRKCHQSPEVKKVLGQENILSDINISRL